MQRSTGRAEPSPVSQGSVTCGAHGPGYSRLLVFLIFRLREPPCVQALLGTAELDVSGVSERRWLCRQMHGAEALCRWRQRVVSLIPAKDHCGPPENGREGKIEPSLGPPEEDRLSSGEDGEGTHALFSDIGLLELSGMNLCNSKLLGLW